MKQLQFKLKILKMKDVFAIFIFLLMIIPSLMFKLALKIKNKKVWLICDDGMTARDNGYYLFKYIKENNLNDNVYYVISKDSKDLDKVKKYGNIIYFKSLKHWLYYMSCNKNIISQKSGNPNSAIFYVLHVYLNLYNNRIFLQHGITKDDAKWLYYKNTKFKLFVCGAKKEYEYIKNNFGYKDKNIKYLGFSRFDNLHDNVVNNKQILIMPTWRNWLGRDFNKLNRINSFKETEYYKKWNSLINNENLINFIEKNNIQILFYPHINMQKYINDFNTKSKNIQILNIDYDIQKVLKESALLITDYSSVYMDFAYMSKPIIYYQFDYNEYRQKQYQEGYFKYSKDAFGKLLSDEEDVVNKIIAYVNMNYRIENIYMNKINNFFELKDKNNCKRIYESISHL